MLMQINMPCNENQFLHQRIIPLQIDFDLTCDFLIVCFMVYALLFLIYLMKISLIFSCLTSQFST